MESAINTTLNCQKHLFDLEDEHTWLNCAYWSPLLRTVETIGHQEVSKKCRPYQYNVDDFFQPVDALKRNFAKLINSSDHERVAIIPSTSYGMATVVRNIKFTDTDNIVVVDATFPSLYYTFEAAYQEFGCEIKVVEAPDSMPRAAAWNQAILDAIDDNTKVVALGNVHWTDGTVFDLMAIREKTRKHDALLVIDGTQSVGAMPFDVSEIQPDALICAGYKWLFGPYGLGLAWYGPKFDHGSPIEQNWMARIESDDFKNLVSYQSDYRDKAFRYSMGESSQFILAPMLNRALEQIMEWGIENIHAYCDSITKDALNEMVELGCVLEDKAFRSPHLFGVRLSDSIDNEVLQQTLQDRKIHVSLRGSAIRVAPHVYNDANDMDKLVDCFKSAKK